MAAPGYINIQYRMIYTGVPSFVGFGLEGGHVQTFWLLLQKTKTGDFDKLEGA